jgi:hypothetical protein
LAESPLWQALTASLAEERPAENVRELWLLVFDYGGRVLLAIDGVNPAAEIQEGTGTWHPLHAREVRRSCHWQRGRDGQTHIRVEREFVWKYVLHAPESGYGTPAKVTADFTPGTASVWVGDWERHWKRPLGPVDAGAGPFGAALRLSESVLPASRLQDDAALRGGWLKLSSRGGTYLVQLSADGILDEVQVLNPNRPQLDGYWWVERTCAVPKLHICLGFWRLSVPAFEDKQLDDKLDKPFTFQLPPDQNALMRCAEEEPRLLRRAEFLVGRLWSP